MPALPRLTTLAMRALASRLKFVPPEVARRQLARAEALAAEVMTDLHEAPAPATPPPRPTAPADRAYPVPWILWRLTGYRDPAAALARPTPAPPAQRPPPRRADRARAASNAPAAQRPADFNSDINSDISADDQSEDAARGVILAPALLADLAALIEHLSVAAELTRPDTPLPSADHAPDRSAAEQWLTVEDLCARWSVSRKSIERWRRQGLWCRRVRADAQRDPADGDPARNRATRARKPRPPLGRSFYAQSTVERFEQLVRASIPTSSPTSSTRGDERSAGPAIPPPRTARRLTPRDRERIRRHAERYQRLLNWPLMRICRRLAERFQTTPETVRRTIRLPDAGNAIAPRAPSGRVPPPAGASAPPRPTGTTRERMAAMRADRADQWRALRAVALREPLIVGPTFDRPEAAEVLLAPAAARAGFRPWRPEALGEPLAEANAPAPADAATIESQRAVALCFLRWRSHAAFERTPPRAATADDLDRAAVDLVWAARLRTELVRSQLGLILRTIHATLGADLTPERTGEALAIAITAAAAGADRFDPFKGGRLAAPVALAISRALAEWRQHASQRPPTSPTSTSTPTSAPPSAAPSAPVSERKLARRIEQTEPAATPPLPPEPPLPDWQRAIANVSPWRAAGLRLEPPPTLAHDPALASKFHVEHAFLQARWGWPQVHSQQVLMTAPRTLAQTAQHLGIPLSAARGLQRRSARLWH